MYISVFNYPLWLKYAYRICLFVHLCVCHTSNTCVPIVKLLCTIRNVSTFDAQCTCNCAVCSVLIKLARNRLRFLRFDLKQMVLHVSVWYYAEYATFTVQNETHN